MTVGEDGCACLVDLERLGGMNGQMIGASSVGGGWRGGGSGGVIYRGQPKGGLPLSGVAFQGEQEEARICSHVCAVSVPYSGSSPAYSVGLLSQQ